MSTVIEDPKNVLSRRVQELEEQNTVLIEIIKNLSEALLGEPVCILTTVFPAQAKQATFSETFREEKTEVTPVAPESKRTPFSERDEEICKLKSRVAVLEWDLKQSVQRQCDLRNANAATVDQHQADARLLAQKALEIRELKQLVEVLQKDYKQSETLRLSCSNQHEQEVRTLKDRIREQQADLNANVAQIARLNQLHAEARKQWQSREAQLEKSAQIGQMLQDLPSPSTLFRHPDGQWTIWDHELYCTSPKINSDVRGALLDAKLSRRA